MIEGKIFYCRRQRAICRIAMDSGIKVRRLSGKSCPIVGVSAPETFQGK